MRTFKIKSESTKDRKFPDNDEFPLIFSLSPVPFILLINTGYQNY